MRLLALLPFLALMAAASAASLPLPTQLADAGPLLISRTPARGCDLLGACFSSLKNTLRGGGASSVPEVPGRTSREHRYSSVALSRMPSHRLTHSSSASGSASGLGSGSPMGSPPRPPRHSPKSKGKGKSSAMPPMPMSMEKLLPNKPRPELARAKSPLIAPTVPPNEVKMSRGRGRKNEGKLPYFPPPPSGPFGSGYGSAAAQEKVWKGARDDVSAMMDGSSSQDRKSTLAALKGRNGGKKPAQAR